jgi:histidinol dehydrogenase
MPGPIDTAPLQPGLLRRVDLRGAPGDPAALLPAPEIARDDAATATVRTIIDAVRARGDNAVREFTERFDRVAVDDLRVADSDVRGALDAVGSELRESLVAAHANIFDYHRSQLSSDPEYRRGGVGVRELRVPVETAGLYVPGGRAPLASSVLMTAAPARAAGVGRVVVCSPPGTDGRVAPSVLAAAAIAGVDDVFCIGGAQAVAAMAYGTASVPKVDVVAGPGNRYVALAERIVASEGVVGVPSAFTGPSEVAVVADDSTPAEYAAIDLVVQAEHGPDGVAYLITWSERAAERIADAVLRIASSSPRRDEIESSLSRGGFCVMVSDAGQAMAVANAVAAEHLEIMTSDPEALVPLIRCAGAVFLGHWAPASIGDYVAGPNHVLPTARSARFASALRIDDFCRRIHVVALDRQALGELGHHVEVLATSEGLAAHADSVRVRLAGGEARS